MDAPEKIFVQIRDGEEGWTYDRTFSDDVEFFRVDYVARLEGKVAALEAENARLREALETLRITKHYECDDCWFSCPKAEHYCNDDGRILCDCGMDRTNKIIDAALSPAPEKGGE